MKEITAMLLFFILVIPNAFSQEKNKKEKEKEELNWESVILTKNVEDVKGLKFIDDISSKAQKLYGSQDKLTLQAREKLKKEAAKKGATIVLIEESNFSNSPINNVFIQGKAYKKEE